MILHLPDQEWENLILRVSALNFSWKFKYLNEINLAKESILQRILIIVYLLMEVVGVLVADYEEEYVPELEEDAVARKTRPPRD